MNHANRPPWREPVTLSGPVVMNRELIREIIGEIDADARERAMRERHTWQRVLDNLSAMDGDLHGSDEP